MGPGKPDLGGAPLGLFDRISSQRLRGLPPTAPPVIASLNKEEAAKEIAACSSTFHREFRLIASLRSKAARGRETFIFHPGRRGRARLGQVGVGWSTEGKPMHLGVGFGSRETVEGGARAQ